MTTDVAVTCLSGSGRAAANADHAVLALVVAVAANLHGQWPGTVAGLAELSAKQVSRTVVVRDPALTPLPLYGVTVGDGHEDLHGFLHLHHLLDDGGVRVATAGGEGGDDGGDGDDD